jgi:hypothetical protein
VLLVLLLSPLEEVERKTRVTLIGVMRCWCRGAFVATTTTTFWYLQRIILDVDALSMVVALRIASGDQKYEEKRWILILLTRRRRGRREPLP